MPKSSWWAWETKDTRRKRDADFLKDYTSKSESDPSYGSDYLQASNNIPPVGPEAAEEFKRLTSWDSAFMPQTPKEVAPPTTPTNSIVTPTPPPPTPPKESDPSPKWMQSMVAPTRQAATPAQSQGPVGRWGPIVASISQKYKVPYDVAMGILEIESTGNPGARSVQGAMGLMQVMPFHFKQGEDPYDPQTNISRGLEILSRNYQTYGNWESAAAAYFGAIDPQTGRPSTATDANGTTGNVYVQKFNNARSRHGGPPPAGEPWNETLSRSFTAGVGKSAELLSKGLQSFGVKPKPKSEPEPTQRERPFWESMFDAPKPEYLISKLTDPFGANRALGRLSEDLDLPGKVKDLESWGQQIYKENAPTKRKEWEGPQSLLDPDYLLTSGAEMAGTSIPLSVVGILGTLAASKGIGAMGASKLVSTLAGSAISGLASRTVEGLMEAGGTYEEAKSEGKSDKEAEDEARKTFYYNLPLAATDMLQLHLLTRPFTKASKEAGKSVTKNVFLDAVKAVSSKGPVRLATDAATEGAEEVYQDIAQRVSQGKPIEADKQMEEAFFGGAAMGGVMQAGSEVMGKLHDLTSVDSTLGFANRKKKSGEDATPSEDATPPKNEPHVSPPKLIDLSKFPSDTLLNMKGIAKPGSTIPQQVDAELERRKTGGVIEEGTTPHIIDILQEASTETTYIDRETGDESNKTSFTTKEVESLTGISRNELVPQLLSLSKEGRLNRKETEDGNTLWILSPTKPESTAVDNTIAQEEEEEEDDDKEYSSRIQNALKSRPTETTTFAQKKWDSWDEDMRRSFADATRVDASLVWGKLPDAHKVALLPKFETGYTKEERERFLQAVQGGGTTATERKAEPSVQDTEGRGGTPKSREDIPAIWDSKPNLRTPILQHGSISENSDYYRTKSFSELPDNIQNTILRAFPDSTGKFKKAWDSLTTPSTQTSTPAVPPTTTATPTPEEEPSKIQPNDIVNSSLGKYIVLDASNESTLTIRKLKPDGSPTGKKLELLRKHFTKVEPTTTSGKGKPPIPPAPPVQPTPTPEEEPKLTKEEAEDRIRNIQLAMHKTLKSGGIAEVLKGRPNLDVESFYNSVVKWHNDEIQLLRQVGRPMTPTRAATALASINKAFAPFRKPPPSLEELRRGRDATSEETPTPPAPTPIPPGTKVRLNSDKSKVYTVLSDPDNTDPTKLLVQITEGKGKDKTTRESYVARDLVTPIKSRNKVKEEESPPTRELEFDGSVDVDSDEDTEPEGNELEFDGSFTKDNKDDTVKGKKAKNLSREQAKREQELWQLATGPIPAAKHGDYIQDQFGRVGSIVGVINHEDGTVSIRIYSNAKDPFVVRTSARGAKLLKTPQSYKLDPSQYSKIDVHGKLKLEEIGKSVITTFSVMEDPTRSLEDSLVILRNMGLIYTDTTTSNEAHLTQIGHALRSLISRKASIPHLTSTDNIKTLVEPFRPYLEKTKQGKSLLKKLESPPANLYELVPLALTIPTFVNPKSFSSEAGDAWAKFKELLNVLNTSAITTNKNAESVRILQNIDKTKEGRAMMGALYDLATGLHKSLVRVLAKEQKEDASIADIAAYLSSLTSPLKSLGPNLPAAARHYHTAQSLTRHENFLNDLLHIAVGNNIYPAELSSNPDVFLNLLHLGAADRSSIPLTPLEMVDLIDTLYGLNLKPPGSKVPFDSLVANAYKSIREGTFKKQEELEELKKKLLTQIAQLEGTSRLVFRTFVAYQYSGIFLPLRLSQLRNSSIFNISSEDMNTILKELGKKGFLEFNTAFEGSVDLSDAVKEYAVELGRKDAAKLGIPEEFYDALIKVRSIRQILDLGKKHRADISAIVQAMPEIQSMEEGKERTDKEEEKILNKMATAFLFEAVDAGLIEDTKDIAEAEKIEAADYDMNFEDLLWLTETEKKELAKYTKGIAALVYQNRVAWGMTPYNSPIKLHPVKNSLQSLALIIRRFNRSISLTPESIILLRNRLINQTVLERLSHNTIASLIDHDVVTISAEEGLYTLNLGHNGMTDNDLIELVRGGKPEAPVEEPIRLATLNEALREVRTKTPEERATDSELYGSSRPTDQSLYIPEEVDTVLGRLVSQVNRIIESGTTPPLLKNMPKSDKKQTWTDDIFYLFQSLPLLRDAGHYMEPVSAAISQAQKGNYVPWAMVKRDLYIAVQSALVRAAIYKWSATHSKVLGLTPDGKARKVSLLNSDKERFLKSHGYGPILQRIDDILEKPGDYNLTPAQMVAFTELQHTLNAVLQHQLALGIDIEEIKNYFPRIVVKAPTKEKQKELDNARMGHTMTRKYNTIRDGHGEGFVYADPLTALTERLTHGVELIASRETWKTVRSLGVPLAQEMKADEAISKARTKMAEARLNYTRTRSAIRDHANLTPSETADLEKAKGSLKTAKIELRNARKQFKESFTYRDRYERSTGRIYPPEVLRDLNRYGLSIHGRSDDFGSQFSRGAQSFFQILRATMTTGDFSQFLIQGFNMLNSHPIRWTKTVAYSLASTIRTPHSYVLRNYDIIVDGINSGAISAPEEYLLGQAIGMGGMGRKVSQALMKGDVPGKDIPLFGKFLISPVSKITSTYVSSTQRAFEWYAFVGQVEMAKALKLSSKTGLEKVETAAAIRKSLGVVMRPGLTKGERAADAFIAFAPKFTIAVSTTLTDALRGGVRGSRARRLLGGVLASSTMWTVAWSYLLTGKFPNFDDPDDKEWGSVVVPGQGVFNLYGPYYSYLRTLARVEKAISEGNPDKIPGIVGRFARTKASIPGGIIVDYLMKETSTGMAIEPSLPGFQQVLTQRAGPIGPRQLIDHWVAVSEGRQATFPAVAAEVVGVPTSPYSSYQLLKQKRESQLGGKEWTDLSPEQQKQFNKENPSLSVEFDVARTHAEAKLPLENIRARQEEIGKRIFSNLPKPVQDAMLSVGKNTFEVSASGGSWELSEKNFKLYQKDAAYLAAPVLSHVVKSDYYTSATPEQKQKILTRVKNAITAEARASLEPGVGDVGTAEITKLIEWSDYKGSLDLTRAKLQSLSPDISRLEINLGEAPSGVNYKGGSLPFTLQERIKYQSILSSLLSTYIPKVTSSSTYSRKDDKVKEAMIRDAISSLREKAFSDLVKSIGTSNLTSRPIKKK